MTVILERMRAEAIEAFGRCSADMADNSALRLSRDADRVRPDFPEMDHFVLLNRFAADTRSAVSLPLATRYYRNGTGDREALLLLYGFGDGEAEVSLYCRRFSWTRAALLDFWLWAQFDLNLDGLVARIRVDDHRAQNVARRAGFGFHSRARGHFSDGAAASVWRLRFDECLLPRLYRSLRETSPLPVGVN